jgi:hypothetical protein
LLPSRYAPAAAPGPEWAALEVPPSNAQPQATGLPAPGPQAPQPQAPRPVQKIRPPEEPPLSADDPAAEEPPIRAEPIRPQIEPSRPVRRDAIPAAAPEQPPTHAALVGQAAPFATALPGVAEVGMREPASSEAPPLWAPPDPLAPVVLPLPVERIRTPPLADPAAEAFLWQPSSDAIPPPSRPTTGVASERLWIQGARPSALAALPVASQPAIPGRQTQVAAPDVQISIGVVEVHAVPRGPAPKRLTPARRPQLSLADYLAQRNGKTP